MSNFYSNSHDRQESDSHDPLDSNSHDRLKSNSLDHLESNYLSSKCDDSYHLSSLHSHLKKGCHISPGHYLFKELYSLNHNKC